MDNPTISIRGRLYDFRRPKVMGIVNVTPDSFYSGSRTFGCEAIRDRISSLVAEGADIIDIGGYSSRPGADDVSADEEYSRLARGLEALRDVAPEIPVSVDTFRADVACKCVSEWKVDIINDIGGGSLDPAMFETVADLKAAYILMHMRGIPSTMQTLTQYSDVTADVLSDLAFRLSELRELGVADVIVDPGFGFAKTVDQNFRMLDEMEAFRTLGCPLLAGISRKTMIWKTLGTDPEGSENGTTVLNTVALLRGADILRVHDVRAAHECVTLIEAMRKASPNIQTAL